MPKKERKAGGKAVVRAVTKIGLKAGAFPGGPERKDRTARDARRKKFEKRTIPTARVSAATLRKIERASLAERKHKSAVVRRDKLQATRKSSPVITPLKLRLGRKRKK